MTKSQRATILVAILLLVASAAFPPWQRTVHWTSSRRSLPLPIKYAFVLKPPSVGGQGGMISARIDTGRLLLQWLLIVLLAAGVALLLRPKIRQPDWKEVAQRTLDL